MRFRSLTARVRRRSDFFWPVIALAVALVAARAALPYIVKDYVNDRLHAMNAYDGSVVDIDIGLWRGAYRIDGLEIVKKGAKQRTPFLDSKRVDFSVESLAWWLSLRERGTRSRAASRDSRCRAAEGSARRSRP